MDYRLELEIWCAVQRSMPAGAFVVLIAKAVQSYKRPTGYSHLDRIHATTIGADAVKVLGAVSSRAGQSTWREGDTFVSIRAHLREHIYGYLQHHLISRSMASGAIRDHRMARDLGL